MMIANGILFASKKVPAVSSPTEYDSLLKFPEKHTHLSSLSLEILIIYYDLRLGIRVSGLSIPG